MGFEVDLLGNDTQFSPDVIPVKVDGTPRDPHVFGDLLGGFLLSDEIGDLYLSGGKPRVLRG